MEVMPTNTAKTNIITMDWKYQIKRDGGGAYIDFADSTSEDHERLQEFI